MRLRDWLGILLFAAGVAAGILAYSLRHLLLGVCAALLMVLGLWLINWRKRERDLAEAAFDTSDGPRPWRLWPRHDLGGMDDGPGFDGVDGD